MEQFHSGYQHTLTLSLMSSQQPIDPSPTSLCLFSIFAMLTLFSTFSTWQFGCRLFYSFRYLHPLRSFQVLTHTQKVFADFLLNQWTKTLIILFSDYNLLSFGYRFLKSLRVHASFIFNFILISEG